MIFIYGSASSGKSNIAENMAVKNAALTDTKLVYIATMENESDAARERIRKHKKLREGKGFYTIEEMYKLSVHNLSVLNKTVLVECISNLCANIYFRDMQENIADENDIERMTEYVIKGIKMLSATANELYVVSNDIFCDGVIYDEWTTSYMKYLSNVNKELVNMCDEFYEVVNGIPVRHK